MKKLILLGLSAFCMGACSVDTLENEPVEPQLTVLDVTTSQVTGCSGITFNFADAGRIEVRNDLEFTYLKIIANGDYELTQSNLHIAADISGFPTTKNGGIVINKMDNQRSFNPAVKEYTYKFPLNSFGGSFLVGVYSVFQLGKKKYNFWAGDLTGNQWSYFEYNLYEHPNAGADKSREITLSAAKTLPSWDEVRKVYVGMLDAGVPKGVKVGIFNPSIWEIINRFNDPVSGGIGEYTTVYTIGEGDCTDSVTLILNVIPD